MYLLTYLLIQSDTLLHGLLSASTHMQCHCESHVKKLNCNDYFTPHTGNYNTSYKLSWALSLLMSAPTHDLSPKPQLASSLIVYVVQEPNTLAGCLIYL